MKFRYRLVPHRYYRHHDVQVSLSLPAEEILSLLYELNVGLAEIQKPGPDFDAKDAEEAAAKQRQVTALIHEVEGRREAAAKVRRED